MNEKEALRNRVLVLEHFCLDLLGMLPIGYSPLGEAISYPAELNAGDVEDNAPRETALGHSPRGITVGGHETHTDAALESLNCSD